MVRWHIGSMRAANRMIDGHRQLFSTGHRPKALKYPHRVKIALQPACRLIATERICNAPGRYNWKTLAGGRQNFTIFLKLQVVLAESKMPPATCRLCLQLSCCWPNLSENSYNTGRQHLVICDCTNS